MTKTEIRDFYGRIIGWVETDEVTGDKTGRDFYGRIVGYYQKSLNWTMFLLQEEHYSMITLLMKIIEILKDLKNIVCIQ